jgi:hypothetical protein
MNNPAKNVLLSLAIIVLSSSVHAHTQPSFLQDDKIRQDLHVNPEKSCKSCLTSAASLEPGKVIEQPQHDAGRGNVRLRRPEPEKDKSRVSAKVLRGGAKSESGA